MDASGGVARAGAGTQIRLAADDLAPFVAEWMTSMVRAAPGPCRISLCGGSTPRALYTHLASAEVRDRFPWDRVTWYLGDERFVPHDHPDSNLRMIRETLLAHDQVSPDRVRPVPFGGTPDEAASAYERTLQADYGAPALDPARPFFDLTLLGLGTDGHTASLLPGQPALDERRRWVVAVPHGRPEVRITMTLPLLESSRRVAFLVAGAEKAGVYGAIRSGASTAPAARVRPRGRLIWFVDRAAGGS